MKKWVRRIRAAVGMGLTWGAAWFGAGIMLLLVSGFDADVPFPLLFALLGFVAGITFSGILGVIEGRRRFDQMSLPRFAGWGAVGGLLLSGIFVLAVALGGESLWGEILVLGPVFALAGAASAAGSLALARMAERRELPDPSADPAEAGLTEDERRELLGGGD
ncbi:MAG: hypothetical protein ABR543_12325 [Gemmatimonadaceae bacterium]